MVSEVIEVLFLIEKVIISIIVLFIQSYFEFSDNLLIDFSIDGFLNQTSFIVLFGEEAKFIFNSGLTIFLMLLFKFFFKQL